MKNQLNKEIAKGLLETCIGLGFSKTKYYFVKPLKNNVTATLIFVTAHRAIKDHILVNCSVGVSHKQLEEYLFKLTGRDKVIFSHTVSKQIGYLMPENQFKEWDFVSGTDNSNLFHEIKEAIKKYAFPYFEQLQEFDTLFEAIKKRDGLLHYARDRYLPILYYLKGDQQAGLKAISEAIERQQTPFDPSTLSKFEGATEILTIVGSGIGKVDPNFLKFAENYKKLWE